MHLGQKRNRLVSPLPHSDVNVSRKSLGFSERFLLRFRNLKPLIMLHQLKLGSPSLRLAPTSACVRVPFFLVCADGKQLPTCPEQPHGLEDGY